MQAAVTDGQGRLELMELSMPQIGPYDCLVEMEACAFCNTTDRHIVNGSFPRGSRPPALEVQHYPAVLGHESCGIIRQCGDKVRHFRPGQRVLGAYCCYPDETLQNSRGQEVYSFFGGFAEWGKVCDGVAMAQDGFALEQIPGWCHAQQVIPETIALEQTWLMIPQKEIYSSCMQIPDVAGGDFLIAGAGSVGILFSIFLKLAGAGKITVAARRKEQLEVAKRLGRVDETILLQELGDRQFPNLIDCIGNHAVLDHLLPHLSGVKTVYSYAVYPDLGEKDFIDRMKKRCDFHRIDPDEPVGHEAVCRLLQQKLLDPAPFIDGIYPLSKLDEAWQKICSGTTCKIIIKFK